MKPTPGMRHIKWYAPIEVCDAFRKACADCGMSQTEVMRFFMQRFVEHVNAGEEP